MFHVHLWKSNYNWYYGRRLAGTTMWKIPCEWVLALKRAGLVLTLRTVYSARLQENVEFVFSVLQKVAKPFKRALGWCQTQCFMRCSTLNARMSSREHVVLFTLIAHSHFSSPYCYCSKLSCLASVFVSPSSLLSCSSSVSISRFPFTQK